MARKLHIVGNWKMNQSLSQSLFFLKTMETNKNDINCEAWVAPQLPLLKTLIDTNPPLKI